MFIEGLQLVHVRVDSSRRADCPGGDATQRPGGQDDCFETDASKVLSVLENRGVDVSEGVEVSQSNCFDSCSIDTALHCFRLYCSCV